MSTFVWPLGQLLPRPPQPRPRVEPTTSVKRWKPKKLGTQPLQASRYNCMTAPVYQPPPRESARAGADDHKRYHSLKP